MSLQNVTIKQNRDLTGSNLKIEDKGGLCEKNKVTTFIYNWPYNIAALGVIVDHVSCQIGDTFSLHIAPLSTLSVLSVDVKAGDTKINLSSMISEYNSPVNSGYFITITDGVNTEELGRVISYDNDEKNIVIENTPIHNYSTSNTTIKMTVILLDTIHISNDKVIPYGSFKINGSVLLANTPIHLLYTNTSKQDKYFYTHLEYLY